MKPFEINISMEAMPDKLTVVPKHAEGEDPKYEIYVVDEYLGTVWPDCTDQGKCWFASDELAEDTVLKIGDAIEMHGQ